jgi:hypothetical protein
MPALRASFSIAPNVLRKFNELVPAGERSRVIESLMERVLVERGKKLQALAHEFETHPDFAQARSDGEAFDVTVADGLDDLR